MAQEQKKDLNFKYNYGKKVRPVKKKAVQSRPVRQKKPGKPMGLGMIALRNIFLLILTLALLGGFFLLGMDITSFTGDDDLSKHAEITSALVTQEGKWVDWQERVITVKSVDKGYTFAAAVLDCAPYSGGGMGSIVIESSVDTGSVEHILLLDPPYPVTVKADVKVYTNDETYAQTYGIGTAEAFYAEQESYEAEHAGLLSVLKHDPDHLLNKVFQGSTWKWIVLGVLALIGGLYAIYRTMERDWFHEEGLTNLTILYAASMLATAFGCMILFLMGESMYSDGGIAQLLVRLFAICTGISALVYLIAMLVPVLLDRDFLYGLSVFVWKIVLSLVVALITFGIGALLYEIMEVYKIVHTVLAIGMVALMIFLFFAFVGFCAAHSVIVNCYVDVSFGILETIEAVETEWYNSIDWEATKKKRQKLLWEAEDILHDDGT